MCEDFKEVKTTKSKISAKQKYIVPALVSMACSLWQYYAKEKFIHVAYSARNFIVIEHLL
jgi:hypothetical protein